MTQLKAAATEKKPPQWYMTFLSQFHALYSDTACCVVWPSRDQLRTCNASGYQTIYKLAYGAWCSTSCVLLVQHDGEWTPVWCYTNQGLLLYSVGGMT